MTVYEIAILENLRGFAFAMLPICASLIVVNTLIYTFLNDGKETPINLFHKKISLGIFIVVLAVLVVSVAIVILTPNAEAFEILKLKAVSNG